MKRIRSPSSELWHILAVYSMMCQYDLTFDLFSQNWVTSPGGRVESMCLFGSLLTFRFWHIINCRFSDPWLGNRRCHSKHFGPHSLGCPPRESRRVWSWCDNPLWSYAHFTCINYMPVWPGSLTYFYHNWDMWPWPHREHMCILRTL